MNHASRTPVRSMAASILLAWVIAACPLSSIRAQTLGALESLKRLSPEAAADAAGPGAAPVVAAPVPVQVVTPRTPLLNELNREISGLYKFVSPSVVTLWIVDAAQLSPDGLSYGVPEPAEGGRVAVQVQKIGNGSGFIVSPDGIIATNKHVAIEAAKRVGGAILAEFSDGTKALAQTVRIDPDKDLAVLQVKAKKPLTPARLGDSDKVEVGESVFALGSPLGLPQNFTWGTVNAMRDMPIDEETGETERFIQMTAVINPGNSGGPLFNVRGEVVGINTMIIGAGGVDGFTGNGLALPVNDFKAFLADTVQLIHQKKSTQPAPAPAPVQAPHLVPKPASVD